MDVSAIIGAILANPAFNLALGFVIGAWLDGRRRADERRERDVERERAAISDLQFGLVEVEHGGWAAQITFDQAVLKLQMALDQGADVTRAIEAMPNMHEQSWHQDWLASIRKVSVMLARIRDPELQRLANKALHISEQIQAASSTEYEKRRPELHGAITKANIRAGQLYQELGVVLTPPWYRRLWEPLRQTDSAVRASRQRSAPDGE